MKLLSCDYTIPEERIPEGYLAASGMLALLDFSGQKHIDVQDPYCTLTDQTN
jgi:hypothetical protein